MLREIQPFHALSDAQAKGGTRPQKPEDVIRFNLGYTQVTDVGLAEIADLKNLTAKCLALTTLPLHNTKVTDADLQALAPLQNLTRLSLPSESLTDKCLAELQKLNLLHALEEAKGTNKQRPQKLGDVIELDLSSTKITNAGLQELTAFTSLAKLYLPSSVTEAGVKKLQGVMPKCKIERAQD